MTCGCTPFGSGTPPPAPPDPGLVANWYLDASIVIPANQQDGLTPATAYKTSAQLCQRLCPGGAEYYPSPTIPKVTIHVAPGSYGGLDLRGVGDPSLGAFAQYVQVDCAYTSSDPIVLTAVVNTVDGVTRGQVSSAATPFPNRRRLRVVSGTATGAKAYTCGQNASANNFFVSRWWNYDTATSPNVPPGSEVIVDTLTVSFSRVRIHWTGPSYFELRNAIVHNECTLFGNGVAGTVDMIGCDLRADSNGGFANYVVQNAIVDSCAFLSGEFGFGAGFPYLYACEIVQGAKISTYTGAWMSVQTGCIFDGGTLAVWGSGSLVQFSKAIEFENGVASAAIDVRGGGIMSFGGLAWGLSAPYATGINLNSMAFAYTNALANVQTPGIPATTQLNMTGHALTYAQIPRSYDRAGCVFALSPDPAAVATTT